MKHCALVLVSQDLGGERPWRSRAGVKAQGRVTAGAGARLCQASGGLLVLVFRPSGSLGTQLSSWTHAVPASEEHVGGSCPPQRKAEGGDQGPPGRSWVHTLRSREDSSVHKIVSRRDEVCRPMCFVITRDSVFRHRSHCWPAVSQKRMRLVFYKQSFG